MEIKLRYIPNLKKRKLFLLLIEFNGGKVCILPVCTTESIPSKTRNISKPTNERTW